MKTGFFTMDLLNQIDAERDFEKAKQMALDAVNAQPDAEKSNITKAKAMINTAKNKQRLVMDIGNFILAHPSENLKVLK